VGKIHDINRKIMGQEYLIIFNYWLILFFGVNSQILRQPFQVKVSNIGAYR